MSSIVRTVKVFCPYCSFENRFLIDRDGRQMVYCDVDEGGCDESFVIDALFSVEVDVYRLEPVQEAK